FIYCVLIAATVIGNGIVLFIFYKRPSLRIPVNFFIINLAITDILTGLTRQPIIVIDLLSRGESFIHTICGLSGVTLCVCYVVTIFTLLATALCRYLVIVRSYGRKLSTKVVVIIMSFIWVYGTIDCLLPIFGWNRYVYQPEEYTCLPDWQDSKGASYIIYILIIDSLIPWTVTAVCYTGIYLFIKKHVHHMLGHLQANTLTVHQQLHCQALQREVKITKVMFLYFLTFILCYMPYCLTMFILVPNNFHISHHLVFFVGCLINLNSAINPVLYALSSKKFRKAYNEIF
ncbi:uncharacterized protein TRIADDRAFT_4017, partial [Trichoplax adhaerens]